MEVNIKKKFKDDPLNMWNLVILPKGTKIILEDDMELILTSKWYLKRLTIEYVDKSSLNVK